MISSNYVSTTQASANLPHSGVCKADITAALERFDTIGLKQLDRVALLNRIDTKYLLNSTLLLSLLPDLELYYDVLCINAISLNRYRTIYFDTADFLLYHRHHAGALNRYKVRSREYVDTNKNFLEVKHKTNKSRTVKSRVMTESLTREISSTTDEFLYENYPLDVYALQPQIQNRYKRITLVSKSSLERLTIDLELNFKNDARQMSLDGLVIAEVKQARFSQDSPFVQLMRKNGMRPTGFSKYCIGTSLLYPHLKSNNFKRHQMLVKKLSTVAHKSDA